MYRLFIIPFLFWGLLACSGPKPNYYLNTADWQDLFREFFPDEKICDLSMQVQYLKSVSPNLPPPPQAHMIQVSEALILELAELKIWQEDPQHLIDQLQEPLIKERYHKTPFSIFNDCSYEGDPIESDEVAVLHFSKPFFSSDGNQLMLFVEETYLSRGLQRYYLFNKGEETWELRKKKKFNEWIQ